jgi:L-aminopeptidase/D-esterase-like protein
MIKKRELHPLEGVLVGQAEDLVAMTGCTVVIVPDGAVCGWREVRRLSLYPDTDALDPISNRTLTHAVCSPAEAALGFPPSLGWRRVGRTGYRSECRGDGGAEHQRRRPV